MVGSFSLGVVISAALSSNFSSAMLGTQRAMKKLESSTGILKHRQQELLAKTRRYGISGAESARRVRNEYHRMGQEVKKLTGLQTKLTDVTNRGNMLRGQRIMLAGKLTGLTARAAIAAAPVIRAAKGYAADESQVTSIAQGAGDFSPAFKNHVLAQARKTSVETGKSTSDMLGIMDTLTDAQWKQSDKQDVSVFTDTAEIIHELWKDSG